MVQQLDVQQLPCRLDLSGDGFVRLRRIGLSRGMIVGDDDPHCIRFQSRSEQQSDIHNGACYASRGCLVDAKHLVGLVEQQDLELLDEFDLVGIPAFHQDCIGGFGGSDLRPVGALHSGFIDQVYFRYGFPAAVLLCFHGFYYLRLITAPAPGIGKRAQKATQ